MPVVSPHWQTHHTKCLCVFCPIVPTCVRKPFTCRTVRRTKPDAIRPPSTSTSRTPTRSQAGSTGSTSHRRRTNGVARPGPGHHDVTRKCAPTRSLSQQPEHSSTPSAAAARAAKAALAVTVVHSPRAPRASCPAKSDSESPSAAAPIPVARPSTQYSGVQFVSMSHLCQCYCCCYCCCICCSPPCLQVARCSTPSLSHHRYPIAPTRCAVLRK